MLIKKYGNLAMGVFFTLASVIYFYMASQLPASAVMKIGPSFVPKIIAALTFILGVVLTWKSYEGYKKFIPQETAPGEEPSYAHVVLTIAAFAVYVYTLESIGFLIGTFIYLALQILILSPKESRRPIVAVLVSLIATVAIYYVFRQGLTVMLPRGILG